ncbi:NUDIX hydrolase [Paenibacillus sp. XY044]|uniref:NUDIX hydrolase n=1 Tax=Paenibacillus sp. XY044 TaxID=2026089 RepID=UPI000B97CB22|nr:NUDIX hydrolase [Paenibacillus sp. XY044]OZB94101.1 hypothetical protein CJP46_17955 [Paenibacillus sp. XY044]
MPFPTHIVAAGGFVEDEQGNILLVKTHDGAWVYPGGGELAVSEETTDSRWVAKERVLDFITHPAIRTRYQAYIDFNGSVNYIEYVTNPEFLIKLQTDI